MNMQMRLAQPLGFLGEYDKTRPLLESALDSARELGDRQAEANTLAQLGRLVGAWQEDAEGGRVYLEQALEINKELDDKEGMAIGLISLTVLYAEQGDYEHALESCLLGVETFRALDDAYGVVLQLSNASEIYGKLNDYDNALQMALQVPAWGQQQSPRA